MYMANFAVGIAKSKSQIDSCQIMRKRFKLAFRARPFHTVGTALNACVLRDRKPADVIRYNFSASFAFLNQFLMYACFANRMPLAVKL